MKTLSENLIHELNCETVFTLPIFGGIGINESTVITWGIILTLGILSFLLTRNLKVENPGKLQLLLEAGILWVYNFFEDILGKENKRYIPYLVTVLIYLAISNTIVPYLGFKPPTKDLNVTAGLAIMSMFLIEFSAIYQKGLKGWAKNLAEPVKFILPINIMEIFIRPLSLCMRLLGNILAAFVVMELIKLTVPLLLPLPFSFYFDIFDGLLQAYIFVFLTAIFINEKGETL
jgi:F-type H+-transporting ATPase subunit a